MVFLAVTEGNLCSHKVHLGCCGLELFNFARQLEEWLIGVALLACFYVQGDESLQGWLLGLAYSKSLGCQKEALASI